MSDFTQAIQVVLKNEGLTFTNDPKDSGGATKFGLTLKTLQGTNPDFTLEELEDMTQEQAEDIYKTQWWDKYKIYTINNQVMANKVLDTMVNLGPNHATRIIQKSVHDSGIACNIDGVMGPATIANLNSPKCLAIVENIKANLVAFYNGIVANNPSQERFIKGWLNRANE